MEGGGKSMAHSSARALVRDQSSRRGYGALLLAALLAAALAYFAVAPSPASAAVNICTNVTLQPFGHAGDRCFGPMNNLFNSSVITFERAGCVSVANGSNEIIMEWRCGAAGSSPGAAALIFPPLDGVNRKGVIRNNNLSFTGRFQGAELCYSGC
jgi:hypothetical protein